MKCERSFKLDTERWYRDSDGCRWVLAFLGFSLVSLPVRLGVQEEADSAFCKRASDSWRWRFVNLRRLGGNDRFLLPWHVPWTNRCLLSASLASRYLIVGIIVYAWYDFEYGRGLSVVGCVYFNVQQTYATGTCCQNKKTKRFLRLLVRRILDCSSILRNINSFVEFLKCKRYYWKAYILKIFRSKRYRRKLSTRFLIYFNIRRRNEWSFFVLKNSLNARRMAKNACGWFGSARRPINSLLISRSLASIAWLTPVCPFQWLSPAPYNVFPSSSTAILPVYTSQDRNRS